jgi:hypothetical protein
MCRWSVVFLVLIVFVYLSPSISSSVWANQTQDPPTNNSTTTPRSLTSRDIEAMEEYKQATADCSTPSLECLVHYTSRYVAIEWLQHITGSCDSPTCADNATGGGSDATTNATPDPNYPTDPTGQRIINTIPASTSVAYKNGGLIGALNYLMAMMYGYPAASSEVYIAYLMDSSGLATPAYAQGLGFSSLNPVLGLWIMFRNVAYTFFVLIFIVIGFLIMFRTKIGGQTAVTAQQAVPNIIMSLLFVTFSYPIAGLLIDGMYLIMYLILGLFGSVFTVAQSEILGFNIIQLIGMLFKSNLSWTAFSNNADIVGTFLDASLNTSGSAVGGFIEFVGSWFGSLLLTIIIAVAVVIATVKLFFELLRSYASIIISIAVSPLVLMFGAIPGKDMFRPWVTNLIGNLSVFPTTLFVVIIYYQFTSQVMTNNLEAGGFMPPFMFGRGAAGGLVALVGLAVIIALPEIVKKVKEALGGGNGLGAFIAQAAGERFKKAEPAIPMIAGGIGAAQGLYKGYQMAGDGGKSGKGLGQKGWKRWKTALTDGARITGDDGEVRTYGGAKRTYKDTYSRTMSIRRLLDRAYENRLLDAEDPGKSLTEIASILRNQNQGGDNKSQSNKKEGSDEATSKDLQSTA